MEAHRQSQHRIVWGAHWDNTPPPEYPQLYCLSLPKKAGLVEFPAKGCSGRATSHTKLRIQFMHFHMRDAVVILEEGNHPPHPIPQMKHVRDLVGAQQTPPQHFALHDGCGKEAVGYGG